MSFSILPKEIGKIIFGHLKTADVIAFQSASKTTFDWAQITAFWLQQMQINYPVVKEQMEQDAASLELYHYAFSCLEEANKKISWYITNLYTVYLRVYIKQGHSLTQDAEILYWYYTYLCLDPWVTLLPSYQNMKDDMKSRYYDIIGNVNDEGVMAKHGYYLCEEAIQVIDGL